MGTNIILHVKDHLLHLSMQFDQSTMKTKKLLAMNLNNTQPTAFLSYEYFYLTQTVSISFVHTSYGSALADGLRSSK